MKPTELATMQFRIAGNWGQRVVEDNSSNMGEDLKNIAAACRDTAGGLEQMAVGLRATYMLLEEIKQLLTVQNSVGFRRP